MTFKINPFQKLLEGAVFASVSSFLLVGTALAGPNGAQIESGSGSVVGAGTSDVLVKQNSQRIINWKSFDTAIGESVTFDQPNMAALALNRITNDTPTRILGNISRWNGK